MSMEKIEFLRYNVLQTHKSPETDISIHLFTELRAHRVTQNHIKIFKVLKHIRDMIYDYAICSTTAHSTYVHKPNLILFYSINSLLQRTRKSWQKSKISRRCRRSDYLALECRSWTVSSSCLQWTAPSLLLRLSSQHLHSTISHNGSCNNHSCELVINGFYLLSLRNAF